MKITRIWLLIAAEISITRPAMAYDHGMAYCTGICSPRSAIDACCHDASHDGQFSPFCYCNGDTFPNYCQSDAPTYAYYTNNDSPCYT